MAAASRPKLDVATQNAAREFLSRVAKLYAIESAILFGSRARGTHGSDSDADIAVVLEGPRGKRTAAALDMAGIAFDVFLETGVLVEALPLWREEFDHPELFGAPSLMANIRREGVAL